MTLDDHHGRAGEDSGGLVDWARRRWLSRVCKVHRASRGRRVGKGVKGFRDRRVYQLQTHMALLETRVKRD